MNTLSLLKHMQEDLKSHKRAKADLMRYYIASRLDASLKSYCIDLDKDLAYLENRNELRLAKRIIK